MGWISRKELKIYFLVVSFVTVAALLITLAILLPDYIRYSKVEKQSIPIPDKTIDMSRFVIPESYKHLLEDKWIPFRPDRDKWTEEEIKKYWQDPKEAILEYLEKENEILIDELFKEIP